MWKCGENALKRVPKRMVAWKREEVACGLLQIAHNDLLPRCDEMVDDCYRYRRFTNTTIAKNNDGAIRHRCHNSRDYLPVNCHTKRGALPLAHRRQVTNASGAHPL